jgi:hypothetical protein
MAGKSLRVAFGRYSFVKNKIVPTPNLIPLPDIYMYLNLPFPLDCLRKNR